MARIKETPVYEFNPPESVDNPKYIASRVVRVIREELPEPPVEEIPRYIVSQEEKEDAAFRRTTEGTKDS